MNVSTLEGAELDAAVARALGWRVEGAFWVGATTLDGAVTRDDSPVQCGVDRFSPSRSWAHGGPLVERESIRVEHMLNDWEATVRVPEPAGGAHWASFRGSTPLIAAMRAFVASKQEQQR